MAWKIYDDSIQMIDMRFQFLPDFFRWRGRCYHVESIDRCWTVSRRRWRHRTERRYFQVQSSGGTFELFQDLKSGTWHLRRAILLPARAPIVRHAAPAWR